MTARPTRGAGLSADADSWAARPTVARMLRLCIVIAPGVCSLVITWVAAPHLYRPAGWTGILVWVMQLGALGFATAVGVERLSRRLVPMINLLGMSLVFPDQAPSRFGVALRSGSTRHLEQEVEHLRVNGISNDATEAAEQLLVLVSALGRHERLTRGHTERVRAYAELIGEEMGLSAEDQNRLRWGSLIHDVGKLAVPAPILSKEERLEDAEWQTIKLHPEVGAALVQPLEDWLGEWRLAASEHHERWDGAGYPYGLAGTDISLAGRIVAVADTYDVITSTRSYKTASSAEEARKELVRCSGSQFDPDVVRAFLAVSVGRLHPIAGRFAWMANLALVFQQAPAAIQTAVVGGAAAVVVSGGLATGAIDLPDPPEVDEPGVAAERTVDSMGFVFPSIPAQPDDPTLPPGPSGGPIFAGATTTSSTVPAGTSLSTTVAPSSSSSIPTATTTSAPTTSAPPTATSTSIPGSTTTTMPPTTTQAPSDCERAQGGELILSGADLTGCDLAGLDMANASLDQADLTGADLTATNLVSAVMADSNLTGAVFVGAVLDDARMGGSDAIGADFTDASLFRARLGGVDLTDADLTRANLFWAVGQPHNTDLAIWLDTTCPNGVVQSTDCYA